MVVADKIAYSIIAANVTIMYLCILPIGNRLYFLAISYGRYEAVPSRHRPSEISTRREIHDIMRYVIKPAHWSSLFEPSQRTETVGGNLLSGFDAAVSIHHFV